MTSCWFFLNLSRLALDARCMRAARSLSIANCMTKITKDRTSVPKVLRVMMNVRSATSMT